jgi:hypothetical protein
MPHNTTSLHATPPLGGRGVGIFVALIVMLLVNLHYFANAMGC